MESVHLVNLRPLCLRRRRRRLAVIIGEMWYASIVLFTNYWLKVRATSLSKIEKRNMDD